MNTRGGDPPSRSPGHSGGEAGRAWDLETAIARAIDEDELIVYYQPIIHVPTGVLWGFEALVRWDRADGRRLLPDEFIPVAEASDLICELDTWVLKRAADQLAAWNRSLQSRQLLMAVNVSSRHVNAPRFRDDVATPALGGSDLDPSQLVLEITETGLVDDDAGIENLRHVRRAGVTLALDDVGTGMSSLTQLARLPVDIAKIDRSFLAPETRRSRKSFRSLVEDIRSQGVVVMVEGVERPDQLELAKEVDAELAQGFALGRPMTPDELTGQWRNFRLPLARSETDSVEGGREDR